MEGREGFSLMTSCETDQSSQIQSKETCISTSQVPIFMLEKYTSLKGDGEQQEWLP